MVKDFYAQLLCGVELKSELQEVYAEVKFATEASNNISTQKNMQQFYRFGSNLFSDIATFENKISDLGLIFGGPKICINNKWLNELVGVEVVTTNKYFNIAEPNEIFSAFSKASTLFKNLGVDHKLVKVYVALMDL